MLSLKCTVIIMMHEWCVNKLDLQKEIRIKILIDWIYIVKHLSQKYFICKGTQTKHSLFTVRLCFLMGMSPWSIKGCKMLVYKLWPFSRDGSLLRHTYSEAGDLNFCSLIHKFGLMWPSKGCIEIYTSGNSDTHRMKKACFF